MKRKFTNVFFLVAIALAALTSFVSCKDYEDDLRTDSQIQNALLSDKIAQLRSDLEAEVARLEGLQRQCEQNCANSRETLKQEIYTYLQNYYNMTQVNDLFNDYYDKSQVYTKSEVDDLLASLVSEEQLEDKIQEAIDKAKDAQDQVDDVIEKLEENYVTKEELAAEVLTLNNTINGVRDIANAAAQAAADAAQAAANALSAAQAAQTTANEAKTAAQNAQTTADNAKAAADAAQATADAAKELAENLEPRVKALEDIVGPLKTTVDNLEITVTKLGTRIEAVADTARTALAKAEDALQKVDVLRDEYEATKTALEKKDAELAQAIAENFDSINRRCSILHDSIEAARDEALAYFLLSTAALNEVSENLNYRIDSLGVDTRERIKAVDVKIQDLTDIVNDAISRIDGLEDRMDAIEDAVADLTPRVETLEEQVDDLYGLVNDLSDRLNKLITGIIVQGTYNPIYGTFSTPFGIESNVLATYYGKVISGIDEFPTATPNYYYNGEATLTADEVAVFGDNTFTVDESGFLFNNKEGNAGTLYVTVNSAANKDFSGTRFELENTKGEAAQVKLSTLEKENDWVKYFGYGTRAAADNGLYRAKATITSDFAKAAPKFDISQDDVKAIFKDIKANAKNPSKINIGTIAKTAYKAATSKVLPAYGVKAPWSDSQGDHAVYSEYNLAATAIHPLGYGFLNDPQFKFDHVPGLGRIESLINRFADKVKKQLPSKLCDEFGVEKFDLSRITHVDLEAIDFEGFTVDIEVDTDVDIDLDEVVVSDVKVVIPYSAIDDLYFEYTDPNTGDVIKQPVQHSDVGEGIEANVDKISFDPDAQTVHVHFVYSDSKVAAQLQEKFESMKNSLEGINPMLDYIQDYLGSINDLIDRVNDYSLDKFIDKPVDKIIEYLDKINAKLAPYMTPNDWLQPFAAAYNEEGLFRLTTSTLANPVVLKKEKLSLFLTNRTAEMLAPAYKKWVAVVKAYNADGSEAPAAVANAANTGNLNKVLDGTLRRVELNLQPGYIYAIAYQAMDYSGYVSAKKYYVKVK